MFQTALQLLRLATFPPDTYLQLSEWGVPKDLGSNRAPLLRLELCEGVEASLAAAVAAGEPVDLVQLMAWLEPLPGVFVTSVEWVFFHQAGLT